MLKSWAKADLEKRRRQLAELATHIKFLQLSSQGFYTVRRQLAQLAGDFFDHDLFQKLDDFHKCKTGLELVYPAMNWSHCQECVMCPVDGPVPSILRTDMTAMERYISPRIPSSVILALGGWCEGGPSTNIEMYLPTTQSWYQVPTLALPSSRAYHSTSIIGSTLYVIGGFDGDERFRNVVAMDLADPHAGWNVCADMGAPRCFVSSATVQGKLYALGGHSGESDSRRLASCEVYNPAINKWAKIPDMAHERSDAGKSGIFFVICF